MKYLLKHEDIITMYFTVAAGESPKNYILSLANLGGSEKNIDHEYKVSRIYCSKLTSCAFCNSSLQMKKTINSIL